MRRTCFAFLGILLAAAVLGSNWHDTGAIARADSPPAGKRIRIGVYDPRAVAVAYARSALMKQRLSAKQSEMKDAKAANDQAKIKELEEWGQGRQVRLHLQGFAGAPVDDLLAEVKDRLPKVAQAVGVQSIGLRPDYTSADVEAVDITDELVKLWSPDAATLKIIDEFKKTPPAPIEQIARMGPND